MRRTYFITWVLLLAITNAPAMAETMTFPKDSGIVDVTQPPYNAEGNGKTDDTQAIQQALADHPNGNKIVYLPHGTYIISNTLRWPKGSRGGWEHKRTILQGQSRDGSILKLADGTRGYKDPKNPKAMIWTGRKPAQRFRNAIRNLTIDAGDNPGAIAAQFMANNQGCVRHLLIKGNGPIGLDLGYTDEQGPCLIQHVEVRGFDTGIQTKHAVDSITLEHITLINQKKYGLWNNGQCVSLRKLKSQNTVPAVYNQGKVGVMALIDSTLSGTNKSSEYPAIINEAALFARNVKTQNYKGAIQNTGGNKKNVDEPVVEEFVSHKPISQFPSTGRSLHLKIKETPTVAWDDSADWVSPTHFGAKPNDKKDDTAAIQKAIDAGKPTVYLPNGRYLMNETVYLRGEVKRFIGCEARIGGEGDLVVQDTKSPVVIVERIQKDYGPGFGIVHQSDSTLILSSCIVGHTRVKGNGDLFIEDICGGPFELHGQNAWARQLNTERPTTKVLNNGGRLWILGLKTERGGTLVATQNGGKSEIIGGFAYATSKTKVEPMFLIENAAASITLGESCFNGNPFTKLVKEARGGKTKILKKGEAPGRTGGSMLPLYVGW